MTGSAFSLPPAPDGGSDRAALPEGFRFAGIRCGIKHAHPDLGCIVCEAGTVGAGTFTRSRTGAACVVRNAALLPAADVRGVIVNSGNANAMTGAAGELHNTELAALLARYLLVDPQTVLTASTGSIGVPLPVDLVAEAAESLVAAADADPEPFAVAILTTDLTTKLCQLEVTLPGDTAPIHLLGITKGSGMIHPDMATTLGFVCTDAAVAPDVLARVLAREVDETFNAISVDGDTSTNDMVLALASGKRGNAVEGEARIEAFALALRTVLATLARKVAADGEGATRLLRVEVTGAPTREAAKAIACGVCRSSIVKCSVFAGAPEWGRVAMAVGQAAAHAQVALDLSRLRIEAEGVTLYDGEGGVPAARPPALRRALRQAEVTWSIDLGIGDASFIALGCDLGYDYVRINADATHPLESTRAGGVARNLTLSGYSPRLKQQLLVEGLAYVRRFLGLRTLVYVHPAATGDPIPSLAQDLELCLDARMRPLVVVPDEARARRIEQHMRRAGHFATLVPPDAVTIGHALDRGHLAILIQAAPAPDALVDLSLKLGAQKVLALAADAGLRDDQGLVQRLSPESLLAGIERGRFDTSDPDMLVLARHAASRGIPALHIIDARVPHAVVGELFTDEGIGTLITRQAGG